MTPVVGFTSFKLKLRLCWLIFIVVSFLFWGVFCAVISRPGTEVFVRNAVIYFHNLPGSVAVCVCVCRKRTMKGNIHVHTQCNI